MTGAMTIPGWTREPSGPIGANDRRGACGLARRRTTALCCPELLARSLREHGAKGQEIFQPGRSHLMDSVPIQHAVLVRDEISQPCPRGELRGEFGLDDAVVGELSKNLAIALRNLPTRVRKPMRGEAQALLQRHEEIQNHHFTQGAVSAEDIETRRKHGANASDGISHRSDLARENVPIDHETQRRVRPECRGPRRA